MSNENRNRDNMRLRTARLNPQESEESVLERVKGGLKRVGRIFAGGVLGAGAGLGGYSTVEAGAMLDQMENDSSKAITQTVPVFGESAKGVDIRPTQNDEHIKANKGFQDHNGPRQEMNQKGPEKPECPEPTPEPPKPSPEPSPKPSPTEVIPTPTEVIPTPTQEATATQTMTATETTFVVTETQPATATQTMTATEPTFEVTETQPATFTSTVTASVTPHPVVTQVPQEEVSKTGAMDEAGGIPVEAIPFMIGGALVGATAELTRPRLVFSRAKQKSRK